MKEFPAKTWKTRNSAIGENRATRLEVGQGHQTCYHSIW